MNWVEAKALYHEKLQETQYTEYTIQEKLNTKHMFAPMKQGSNGVTYTQTKSVKNMSFAIYRTNTHRKRLVG